MQKEGPDPGMELILEEEVREIQRIWRMEQGDWQNSAYRIYEEITGKRLESLKEDLGGFGETEQKILHQVCKKHDVPYPLVSKLLNVELDSRGARRHAQIFEKIRKEMTKEWRKDADEIMEELYKQRKEGESVKTGAFKENNNQ